MRSLRTGILQQERNMAVKKQYALSFDGVNDYVDLGTNSVFNLNPQGVWTTEISLDVSNSNAEFYVFAVSTGTSDHQQYSLLHSGNDTMIVTVGGSRSDINTLFTGDMVVSVSNNNGACTVYKAGDVLSNFSASSNMGFVRLLLGNRPNGQFWYKGLMKDFRIWNTARTAQQIQDNLNKKLTGNEPGLVAYYDFAEGSGSTLFDKTPNANHGIIYGAQWVEI